MTNGRTSHPGWPASSSRRQFRGQGHAARLITAVEDAAVGAAFPVLWLYTNTAARVYARAGWEHVETVQHNEKPYSVMRRLLTLAR